MCNTNILISLLNDMLKNSFTMKKMFLLKLIAAKKKSKKNFKNFNHERIKRQEFF